MLTPIEVQMKSFKSGIGYQKTDVETFINTLSTDYETLFKENKELKEKLKLLSNTLSHYRTIEKEMQDALDLANKAAYQIKADAKLQAKQIEEDAINKAKFIKSEAEENIIQLKDKMYELTTQHDAYVNQCKDFARAQIEFLDSKECKFTL